MMQVKLPRGIKYRVEIPQPGIIIPGSENEPIITVFGRDSNIQYKLISCALEQDCIVQDTYSAGNLDDDEIEMIDSWVEYLTPSLLQEAGVRHTIHFLPDSTCYYDFASQTLYGANGYKEKKGVRTENRENTAPINGEPYKLKKSETAFIELLTRTPNAPFSMEDVEDLSGLHGAGSVTSTWHEFKRHDSAIDATFDRKNGMFFYRGIPQIWVIGEDKEDELTLKKLFEVVGYGDVVASFDKTRLRVCLAEKASPEEKLMFLGVANALIDLTTIEMDINRFVVSNYCPASVLIGFLNRYSSDNSVSLEAVWKALREKLTENLTLSLNASTYHYETEEIPSRLADLKGYTVTAGRLEKSLQRICPAIKSIITSTRVGTDYFGYCDIAVKPSTVVDYIAALVLACFSYCRSEQDPMISQKKTRYQSILTALIRKQFNYSPPGDGKKGIIEEIQRMLAEIQLETREAGLDSSVSKLIKINDLLNLLGNNDSNSLLQTSIGREL